VGDKKYTYAKINFPRCQVAAHGFRKEFGGSEDLVTTDNPTAKDIAEASRRARYPEKVCSILSRGTAADVRPIAPSEIGRRSSPREISQEESKMTSAGNEMNNRLEYLNADLAARKWSFEIPPEPISENKISEMVEATSSF
jgi:hypothetical protein